MPALDACQSVGSYEVSISLSSLLDGDNLVRRTPDLIYRVQNEDQGSDTAIPIEWWKDIVKATAETTSLEELPFEFDEKSDLESFVIEAHTILQGLCGDKRLVYSYKELVNGSQRIIRVGPTAILRRKYAGPSSSCFPPDSSYSPNSALGKLTATEIALVPQIDNLL